MSQVAPEPPSNVRSPHAGAGLVNNKDIVSLLSPGLKAVLDMEPDNLGSVRYSGNIVGWSENRFIAWQMRIDPKMPWRIVHDEESVLRFLANGQACAINTVVTDWHIRGTQRIVYMSWPSELRLQLVRQDPRADLEAPCTIVMSSGSTVEGTLLQLSLHGCRLHAPGCDADDLPVTCSFRLPNGFPIEGLACERRHTFASEDTVVFGCKTDGAGLTPAAQNAIDYFVMMSMSFSKLDTVSDQRVLLLGESIACEPALVEWFTAQGLSLVGCATAIELFARLQSTGARMVFLDADLQDPTSVEIARILQQSEGFADARVVFYGGDPASVPAKADQSGVAYLAELDAKSDALLEIVNALKDESEANPPEADADLAEATTEPESPPEAPSEE